MEILKVLLTILSISLLIAFWIVLYSLPFLIAVTMIIYGLSLTNLIDFSWRLVIGWSLVSAAPVVFFILVTLNNKIMEEMT